MASPVSQDDAQREVGTPVNPQEIAGALKAFGACPGGANQWADERGGTDTRSLATLVARARAEAEGAGREPAAKDIDIMVMALNRGARRGKNGKPGPFATYVVRETNPRQWAIAPGIVGEEISDE